MKKLQEGRLNKLLSKWSIPCKIRIYEGYKFHKENRLDTAKYNKNMREMALIREKYFIGYSNENITAIKRYRELEKDTCEKTEYFLVKDETFYFEIPKMIYEYYNNNKE